LIDAAIAKSPSDVVLHEFRALVLFAMQRYKEAAGTLYAVLSVGPGWDWTTMISLYPDVDVYTKQLRALEIYTKQHPESADAHFVLAYQYMSQGENTVEATYQFQDVLKLVPNDQVSRQLLAMIAPSAARPQDRVPATPPVPSDEKQPPAPQSLVGNWKAPATGGGTIELSLAEDGPSGTTCGRANRNHSTVSTSSLARRSCWSTTTVERWSARSTRTGRISSCSK
jgi:tetratricopeptide (TPR) repeat protein